MAETRTKRPAVFLDRDNTLIHNDGDLGDPAGVKLIQGVASAIASLRGLGYKIVVVSNQGGVARGRFTEADVQKVNQRINDLVRATTGATIDRFYFCPYHPQGSVERYGREHPWRKPQPGMLLQATQDMDLDPHRSWMIGDQDRDTQAGAAGGVRTILLQPQPGSFPAGQRATEPHQSPRNQAADTADPPPAAPDFVARSLIEAVKIVAQQGKAGLREPPPPAPVRPRPHPATRPTPAQHPPATEPPAPTDHTDHTSSTPRPPTSSPPAHHREPSPPTTAGDRSTDRSSDPTSTKTTPPRASTDAKPVSRVPPAPADHTLRQILQELRNQRSIGSDFSFPTVFAIILQMVAAVCLLGALWMGGTDLDQFIRWLGVGLALQLATLAMLLFRK